MNHESRTPGKYERIGGEVGCLVDETQRAHGRSFDKTAQHLELLYPSGIPRAHYGNMLAMVRILEQFHGIAGDRRAAGENPWEDIAGCALLMHGRLEPARKTEPSGNGLTFRKFQDDEDGR